MIQGVRDVFEIIDKSTPREIGNNATDGLGKAEGKIVLIGKGLRGLPFQRSLAVGLDTSC